MPRQARIDTPGALHHIIVRGIERRKIFRDDQDRYSFLERMGLILEQTQTACYAWALIPNHSFITSHRYVSGDNGHGAPFNRACHLLKPAL